MPALVVAGAVTAAWLALAPRTPDLAAQVYRVGLFSREGFAVYDGNWYGGHHLLGYSLLFPPLAVMLGARIVGAIAAIASALLFERLARAHFGERRARLGAIWFAAATATDLLIGRLTYGLGVAIGLAALLALQRGRPRLAALLAAACAAASPVAAAFLVLAGVALAVGERRPRGLAVALPALAIACGLAVAFPEGGREPFAWGALHVVLGCAVAVAVLAPREERVLRIAAALYGVAGVLSYVLPTPMGSNVTRLGAVAAGPVLLCALWGRRPTLPAGRALGVAVLIALAVWQWWAPVREVAKDVRDPSTQAAYYTGVIAFLRERVREVGVPEALSAPGSQFARVEVPFTRSHWEATFLARRFPLARGWEAQLDTKYDGLFYTHRRVLDPARYRAWLLRNGVRYVALPDVPLDPSSKAEARLLKAPPRYLREVWDDAHWRVFRVVDPTPLVTGPADLLALGSRSFSLQVRQPGRVLVRERFTPYWRVQGAAACVAPAPGGWTEVIARETGVVKVVAALSAEGLVGATAPCPARTGAVFASG